MVRCIRQMRLTVSLPTIAPPYAKLPGWAVMLTLLPLDSRPRRIKSPKMS